MNLPIAERELRVAARSPRTYRGRLLAAVIFGLVTAWLLWATRQIFFSPMVAAQTFSFITYMAMITCMFNINTTADSISSEKRGGTLGLLFLTDLKGADIVFGKLAATGLATFYSLLAVIPMFAMPMLMGGIAPESVFKSALTLVNTLFFALAAGLWLSARSWDQKRAMNASVWIAVLFIWGLPGLAFAIEQKYQWHTVAETLRVLSPFYQQQHANPFGMGMISDHFWTSLGSIHALAWLALWRACRILPHQWQDRPVTVSRGRWRNFWHEFRYGSDQKRALFRRRMLDINAVHWLSSRERSGPVWVWVFIVIVFLGWVGMWMWFNFVMQNQVPFWVVGIPMVMIMQLGLWMRVCALASDAIARDRFSGALELLLSTSLSIHEVVRGQWLTVRRQILAPALLTFITGVLVFAVGYSEADRDEDIFNSWMSLICLSALFIAYLHSGFWTGLWMACITRTANGAPGQAMLRLLVVPWASFFLLMTVIGLMRWTGFFDTFATVFLTWFLFCFVNAVIWATRSRVKFYERLRLVAAERYQPPASQKGWLRIFGGGRREMNLSPAAS